MPYLFEYLCLPISNMLFLFQSFNSLFLFSSIVLKQKRQKKKSPSLTLVIENETSQR